MERGGEKETWSPSDKASMKRRCLSIMISEGQNESAKKRGTIQNKAENHKQERKRELREKKESTETDQKGVWVLV